MTELTPSEIVNELDRFVIGQNAAKRAVANALRNRWRRKFIPNDIRNEIIPHNILMIGPTGVGKTEIARRLALLAKCPFIKVEATKFTEVGYVGRDVDSIIRDLVEISMNQARRKMQEECKIKATQCAEDRILDVIVGKTATHETKEKFRTKLRLGILDNDEIEIELLENTNSRVSHSFDFPGGHMGILNLSDMLGKAMGQGKMKIVRLSIKDAFKHLINEESAKLIDEEKVASTAIEDVEQNAIVFLDEIDKITSRNNDNSGGRSNISREGVQRDLLPLIEGTIINTKYGAVKTDHILFIASGAFHFAQPSDLLPELQGRLPVRVKLEPLTEEDLVKILSEPQNNLPNQYTALLKVDGVFLDFTKCGIKTIASIASDMNAKIENTGARRLHTILEKLLEDISFNATELLKTNTNRETVVTIDEKYVINSLGEFAKDYRDLNKFIL